MLRQAVNADPAAVIAIDAGTDEPREVTRGELWRRVLQLRAELMVHGVGHGTCVAVWLPNWSDSLVWQFATATLGGHVIGINTRYNVDEVVHLLDRAQPVVLAIAHDFVKLDLDVRLQQASRISTRKPPSIAVVCGPHGTEPTLLDLARYEVGGGAWIPRRAAPAGADVAAELHDAPQALAVAFTTSGSTGKPKLAAHSSRAVAEHAYEAARAGNWASGDVTLCALPLTGVFAFIPAMATIACGGICLLEPTFAPDTIVADMARFGVTHVVGGDDIVGRLLDAWKAQPCALPRWRRLLLADFNGKSIDLASFAEQQFGLQASGVYGSSELFALTSLWPESVPAPKRWQGGGKPVSARIEVRCADPETGEAGAPGTSGELQFRGYNVVDAYLGAPELREEQLTADGWFRSGDLGVMHADGSFDYVCRAGDALRIKGFLVEPAEIETRIVAHPAVDLVKVVGLKLPDGETEAVAFVLLKANAEAASGELRAWCAQGLARHKVPRSVHVVDEMPTTSGVNGIKIRTAELRIWAQEREQASAEQRRSARGGQQ
ncbi:MAG: AMP-binding protein [Casimicrobiaceae bacterium]